MIKIILLFLIYHFYLFKNNEINNNDKLGLFNLFLSYKYNKLNIKENKIYKLIDNENYVKKEDKFEYKEILYFYNSPNEFNFFKFQTQEYFNLEFIYK